jgi:predicted lipid-binding transport protein (Tim44 family)
MGNSFQFIDIIFFAMIAIFLILRLRGVLGKRDGREGSGLSSFFKQDVDTVKPKRKNGVNLSNNDYNDVEEIDLESRVEKKPFKESKAKNIVTDPLTTGIEQIQNSDPTFNKENFIDGARVAFETILSAYASANVDELRTLVSKEVYTNFASAIQTREKAGYIMEDTLIGITESELVEAHMDGSDAHVSIEFTSQQVNALRDEGGDVVEGDDTAVLTVTDLWTFARNTTNLDPNWLLIATRSLG